MTYRLHAIRAAVVVCALGVAGALLPGSSSAATEPTAGGGVSLRPVPRPGLDTAKSYFDIRGTAGSTLSESVEATNTGQDAVSLYVSPVDGKTGQTSGSVFANRQDPVTGAGRWVDTPVRTIELAPGESRTVPFTVDVPRDATAGDHLAGLAFEAANPVTSQGSFQIKEVLRSVIGVLVVVPGRADFQPTLRSLDIAPMGATRFGAITVGMGNLGTAMAKPELTVALAGPDGYRKSVTRPLDTVLPGASIDYPFPWSDALQAGEYDVTATLVGGGHTVTLTRHVQLGDELVGAVPDVAPPMPATAGGLSPVLLVVIVVAALAAGLLAGGLWRRMRGPAGKGARNLRAPAAS